MVQMESLELQLISTVSATLQPHIHFLTRVTFYDLHFYLSCIINDTEVFFHSPQSNRDVFEIIQLQSLSGDNKKLFVARKLKLL